MYIDSGMTEGSNSAQFTIQVLTHAHTLTNAGGPSCCFSFGAQNHLINPTHFSSMIPWVYCY